MIFLSALLFFSCEGAGTNASDEVTEEVTDDSTGKTSFNLTGTAGSDSVSMQLTFDSSASGLSRAAEDEVAISGFLVYDNLTLSCTGVYDTATGNFNVSATGTLGSIKIVFSLSGMIVNGAITEANLVLSVYENDTLSATYNADMSETSDDVEETTSVCTDTSLDFGFEGQWRYSYSYSGSSYVDTLTLTDSSFTYFDGEYLSYNNGTIYLPEETGTNEWVMVPSHDENMADYIGAPSDAETFYLFYTKGTLSSDGQSLTFTYPTEDAEYYLTNYNLSDLFNGDTTPEKYSEFKVIKVTYDANYDPISFVETNFSAMITSAKALTYTNPGDDTQTFTK